MPLQPPSSSSGSVCFTTLRRFSLCQGWAKGRLLLVSSSSSSSSSRGFCWCQSGATGMKQILDSHHPQQDRHLVVLSDARDSSQPVKVIFPEDQTRQSGVWSAQQLLCKCSRAMSLHSMWPAMSSRMPHSRLQSFCHCCCHHEEMPPQTHALLTETSNSRAINCARCFLDYTTYSSFGRG